MTLQEFRDSLKELPDFRCYSEPDIQSSKDVWMENCNNFKLEAQTKNDPLETKMIRWTMNGGVTSFEKEVLDDAIKYQFRSYPESCLRYIYHLVKFSEITTKIPMRYFNRVVEIGGGFGGMALVLRKLGYSGKYTILDYPHLCLLQKYWLSKNSINSVHSLNILHPHIDKLRDTLLRLVKRDKTLFIATWSLSECDGMSRSNYLPLLENSSGAIITYSTQFREFNNETYFKDVQKELKGFKWNIEGMSYIDQSSYLIGIKC
jgi:hypothetical protein